MSVFVCAHIAQITVLRRIVMVLVLEAEFNIDQKIYNNSVFAQ